MDLLNTNLTSRKPGILYKSNPSSTQIDHMLHIFR